MRSKLSLPLFLVPLIAGAAGSAPEGRWQGTVDIPGRPVGMTLDLAASPAGQWQGSVTMPSLGLAGVALKDVVVSEGRVTFALTGALDSERFGTARVEAALANAAALNGTFAHAGHSAPFSLQRIGAAQVQLTLRSTPVRAALEGEWVGRYELGGYPRDVTLVSTNAPGNAATATFVIVGKQENVLPVDLVVEDGEFVRVESPSYGVVYEARIGAAASELAGTVTLGSTAVSLVMRRASGSR
jgi:hypothetical protein